MPQQKADEMERSVRRMKLQRSKPLCGLMLCACLFLAACGKDGASDQNAVPSGNTVPDAAHNTQGREWVYVPEVITVGDEHADYERMQPVGDTFCYVSPVGDTLDSAKSICRYSLTDQELTTVPIDWPEGGNDWDVGYRFFAQDQSLYMTANVYPADYGSMKRFLCRFDPEGNCLFSKDITEYAGRNVSLRRLTVDGQGRIYIFLDSGEILLYTGDGDYHASVSYGSPDHRESAQIKGACDGADGKFYVCISRESMNFAGGNVVGMEGVRCTLMEIDFENARLLEAAGNLPSINGLCAVVDQRRKDSAGSAGGNDNLGSRYDFLLYDDRAVYGYRLDAKKNDSGTAGEELFVWMDSDINGYCVANLYLMEDGRLYAAVADWMNDDRAIVELKRTKAEQAPVREELVLVTVGSSVDLAAMAVKFNRGNSWYHLTVKSYDSLTDLYHAVLTKEPMDLIDLSGVNVKKLAAQGLFEDLAPYVEQSELFGPSDFVDGILDVYTCDNTLVGIPAEFMIWTVMGNGARLDNKAGLTLEELFTIEERYPGAKAFDGMDKEELMEYLMMFNKDSFIDWDTGVCRFDSDSFKRILSYVSQYPDSAAGGEDEESLSVKIQKGEVLFAVAEMYPMMIRDYVKMFGEDTACVGFPTADGRGGHLLLSGNVYAISSLSAHKENAWRFIEESLTQEKQNELYTGFYISYPSLKRKLDERAAAAIEKEEISRDEINVVLDLIPDAAPCFSVRDDEIINIIKEEAPAYYSGQKGIDDVVGIIQNRIQLYVDEGH